MEVPYGIQASEYLLANQKPLGIVVLGPSGCGKSTFAERLCQKYGFVHLEVALVLQRASETPNDLGREISNLLKTGSNLEGTGLIDAAMRAALESEEAAFRGYVMEGYVTSDRETALLDEWGVFPDLVIQMRVDPLDLHGRRIDSRADPATGRVYSQIELNPPPPEPRERRERLEGEESYEQSEMNYSMEEGEDGEETERGVPEEVKQRLLVRPEDTKERYLAAYDEYLAVRQKAEDAYAQRFISGANADRVMTMDASQGPDLLLSEAETVLATIPVLPVVEPIAIEVPENFDSNNAGTQQQFLFTTELQEDEPPRTLSRFNTYCPVALLEKEEMVADNYMFPVAYRGKVYLPHSDKARKKFLANPHRYLRAPPSMFGLRIVLLGAPLSGKTTLARTLANAYGLRLVEVEELMRLQVETNTEIGHKIKKVVSRGDAVPAELYAEMIADHLGVKQKKKPAASGTQDEDSEMSNMSGKQEGEEGGESEAGESEGGRESPEKTGTSETPGPTARTGTGDTTEGTGEDGEGEGEDGSQASEDDPAKDWVRVGNPGWVLDGFPQTEEQAEALLEAGINPTHVIVLQATPDDEDRLLARAEGVRVDLLSGGHVSTDEAQRLVTPVPATGPSGEQQAPPPRRHHHHHAQQPALAPAEGPRATSPSGPSSAEPGATPTPGATPAGPENGAVPGTPKPAPPGATKMAKAFSFTSAPRPVKMGHKRPPRAALPRLMQIRTIAGPFESYADTLPAILKLMQDKDVPVESIACTEAADTVYGRVRQIVDPFVATPEETTVGEVEEDDFIEYGDAKTYCPVALARGAMLPGLPELALKYQGTVYLFSDENAQVLFTANPSLYLPHTTRPKMPPPRVMLAGPPGAGKTTQAKRIASFFGVPYINFNDEFERVKTEKTTPLGKRIDLWLNPPPPVEVVETPDDSKRNESDTDESSSDASSRDGSPSRRRRKPAPVVATPEEEDEDPSEDGDEEEGKKRMPRGLIKAILENALKTGAAKDKGFILDGFPEKPSQVPLLLSLDVPPDIILNMVMDEETAVKRLFVMPPIPPEVQQRIDARAAAKAAAEEAIAAGQEVDITASGEEEEDPIKMLADETKANLAERTSIGLARTEEILAPFRDLSIRVEDVDVKRREDAVFATAKRILTPIISQRDSYLENAHALSDIKAQAMLTRGLRMLSMFGQYCPVTLYNTKGVGLPSQNFPVLYRQHIFFPNSDKNRLEFISQPVKYINQPPPPLMRPNTWVRPRLAILGGPKSGKTTLAKHMETTLDVVRLSMGEVLRRTVKQKNALAVEVEAVLRRGDVVSDELCVRALKMLTQQNPCLAKGWVLDGYPQTRAQAALMEKADIVPFLVFSHDLSPETALERGKADRFGKDRAHPTFDAEPLLRLREERYRKDAAYLQDYYNTHFLNFYTLDGTQSKWHLYDKVEAIVKENVLQRQRYLAALKEGRASPSAGLCFTDFDAHQGKFGNYCPVSYVDDHLLIDMGLGPQSVNFAAKFQDQWFKCAGRQQMEKFLAQPKKYLDGHELPRALPRALSRQEGAALKQEQLELKGYCPATFASGTKGYQSIIPGSREFAVAYDSKYYVFVAEKERTMFMREPLKFVALKLPMKLPPVHLDIDPHTLPLMGFMEQTLADILNEGLVKVGTTRAVYPYQTVKQSALKLLAIYLKAHNPRNPDFLKSKYIAKMAEFEDACELVSFLHAHNPYTDMDFAEAESNERVKLFDQIPKMPLERFIR